MLVIHAINFAAEKHKGQKRKHSGLPYLVHPVIVSQLIAKYKSDSKHLDELQAAALLHDTLEDTECSYAELEYEFGPLVAAIVMELTSNKKAVKKHGKNTYLKAKMALMSKYAFIIKLLDRYSNILDNPKPGYVSDTIELMAYLYDEREDITERQKSIMNDILEECDKFLQKENNAKEI